MGLIGRLSGVCAALVLSASSAAAVTVTFSHSGVVNYVEANNAGTPLSPSSVVEGDVATLSYSLDLDQAPVQRDPNWSHFVPLPGFSEAAYLSGTSQLAFGNAAPIDLGPLLFQVLLSGSTGQTQIGVTTTTGSAVVFGAIGLPEIASFVDFTNLDNVRNSPSSLFTLMELYLPAQVLGYADSSCGNSDCFVAVGPGAITTTISGLPDIVDTTPTPVPVPAPFLMLGMSMIGLIGFGRSSKE